MEKYVRNEIEDKIGNVEWKNIYFEEGNENSVEGTYVFAKESVYYILFTEKGKIREKY